MLFRGVVVAATVAALSQSAMAVNISFDYSLDSSGFFSDAGRRSVLSAAGDFFSTRLDDNLLAINSGDVNNYSAIFANPATGAMTTINNFSVAADELTIFVGARELGGSTLGEAGPGGFSVSGTSAFLDQSIQRGQGTVQGSGATDFALWGGAIVFDQSANWFFDSSLETDNDVLNNDFYSVALHELGHVLGVGTSDSWHNQIVNNAFTGSAVTTAYGGNPDLTIDGGHFVNGTMSTYNGSSQESALDPSITTGTRKHFTDLDLAALSDVGWDVNLAEVPVPAAAWFFVSGLLGLCGVKMRRG